MQAIDRIFKILDNGNWHRVTEVAEETSTQESKIELISGFLDAYDFLEYDRKTKRIRLSNELQDFFEKIREIEQREATRKSKHS